MILFLFWHWKRTSVSLQHATMSSHMSLRIAKVTPQRDQSTIVRKLDRPDTRLLRGCLSMKSMLTLILQIWDQIFNMIGTVHKDSPKKSQNASVMNHITEWHWLDTKTRCKHIMNISVHIHNQPVRQYHFTSTAQLTHSWTTAASILFFLKVSQIAYSSGGDSPRAKHLFFWKKNFQRSLKKPTRSCNNVNHCSEIYFQNQLRLFQQSRWKTKTFLTLFSSCEAGSW